MIYWRGAFVAASSISLPTFFFSCPPYRALRERGSRSSAAFILAEQPSPRSLLLFLSSLSLSSPSRSLSLCHLASLSFGRIVSVPSPWVTSPCHFLSRRPARLRSIDCTFRPVLKEREGERGEGGNERKRAINGRREGTTNSRRGTGRRKAVWSINDPFRFVYFADSTVPVALCLLIEKGLSVVSEFFFQIFWYIHMYKGHASGKWTNPISG